MSALKFAAAGLLGRGVVEALFLTTRVEWIEPEHYRRFRREGTPVIFAFWHGQLLPLMHYHRGEGITALVSEHADGEYLARVIERHGFQTVRGSSTRGAEKGLKGLVRAARAGRNLAITPDGPKGPRGEFKPGALAVAQMTGLPVVPLAAWASSGWRLRSWDGFLVPRPFSKIRIHYLPPRFVARDATRDDVTRMAGEIGDELNRLTVRLNPSGIDSPPVGSAAHEAGSSQSPSHSQERGT